MVYTIGDIPFPFIFGPLGFAGCPLPFMTTDLAWPFLTLFSGSCGPNAKIIGGSLSTYGRHFLIRPLEKMNKSLLLILFECFIIESGKLPHGSKEAGPIERFRIW